MTREELSILQHALGLDEFGRGRQFRNNFVTGADTDDGRVCERLVGLGLMWKRDGMVSLTGGDTCYFVTDKGKFAVRTESPAPPKSSRSKQRYERFLRKDSGLTFSEWLKRRRETRT